MQKIILYYKFTPISDPTAVRLWQHTLASSLGLKGRILISNHGINGTLGGELSALKRYVRETKNYPGFKGTAFIWSEGTSEHFPKLSVKVREEIVSFGAAQEIQVDENGIVGGGKHLSPAGVHQLVETRGDEVVFFDGRNAHEAAIGKFKDAIIPDVQTSHDFLKELDDPKYDAIKDKPIVTYCTGGIRCEILSSLMKNRGFKEVYQIDGGIVKYGEAYRDEGLWEGSLRVFDDRVGIKFSDKAVDIGECIHCQAPTSNYENCAEVSCNKLVLICEDCRQDPTKLFHSTKCTSVAAR